MENNTLCNRHSLGVNNHTKMYVTYTRIYGWSDYGGESSYQPGYRLENMMWMTLLVYDYIIPGEKIEKACLLSFVLLFSTLSQSIVATTVYAGNILMMEQDSELPVKEDQADITDQDHQEKNTDTENTNSDKEQGTEESTDSDKIVTAYV